MSVKLFLFFFLLKNKSTQFILNWWLLHIQTAILNPNNISTEGLYFEDAALLGWYSILFFGVFGFLGDVHIL